MRASSTRSPAVDAAGVTAGRGMASPRRRPRHAALAAGLWPKRGRPSPEPRQRRGASVAARSAAPVGGCLKVAAKGDAKRRRNGGGPGRAWTGRGSGGQEGPGYGGSGRRKGAGLRIGGVMKPGAMNAERPDIEGSRCKRYAVMFYCISMAVLLIWCQTHRHFFTPRLRATISHRRVN